MLGVRPCDESALGTIAERAKGGFGLHEREQYAYIG